MSNTLVNSQLGLAGPISFQHFRQYLDCDQRGSLPTGLGGAPVNHLAKALLDNGNRLVVYTLDRSVKQLERFTGPDLTIWVGPYRANGRARDLFAQERGALLRAMREDPTAVVHAHWTYEFALAALDSGRPTVVTAHDVAWRVLRLMPSLYRLARCYMDYQVVRRARYIISVSDYIDKSMEHRTKATRWVIPNGLSSESLVIPRVRNEGAGVCATVLNGFSSLKNGKGALAGFQRARRDRVSLRLRMYGEGYAHGGPAHRWAVDHHLDEGVDFIGPLPQHELHADMAAHVDILIHPSLEESFGMALVEAMAMGIPVIGGVRSGAVPWVLGFGRAGLLTDVTSPVEVASAICQLIEDAALRHTIIDAGISEVADRFGLSQVVQQHLSVYDRLLATS